MKLILDGGWNKKDENSVSNNILARQTDFLLENLKFGKKILIITNAKPIDHYKDRISLLVNCGAEVIGRGTKEKIDWGKYDVIFTLGGDTKILFDELLRLDFKIKNLKKSICYIGSSAGTQIMGSFFYDYDRENGDISFYEGFMLLFILYIVIMTFIMMII